MPVAPPAFEPSTHPTAVGTGGATATVQLGDVEKRQKIDRIIVAKTAGAATSFDVEVSTDSTFADETRVVAKFTGASTLVDKDNGGAGYAWGGYDDAGKVYVKITPNSGANNDFKVRVYSYWEE